MAITDQGDSLRRRSRDPTTEPTKEELDKKPIEKIGNHGGTFCNQLPQFLMSAMDFFFIFLEYCLIKRLQE